jgi:hypothetical protein
MVVECRFVGVLSLSLAYGCAGSPIEGSGSMREEPSGSDEASSAGVDDAPVDASSGDDGGPVDDTGTDEGDDSAPIESDGGPGPEDTGNDGTTGDDPGGSSSEAGSGSETGADDDADDADDAEPCDDLDGDDTQSGDRALGNLACDGDPITADGILAGSQDIDWWSYQGVAGCGNGNDRPSPEARLEADVDATVCMFARCPGGNTQIECAVGQDQTSGQGDPGCCGTNETRISTVDCGMTNDESARVFVEVIAGQNASCTAYTLEVRFES